MSRVAINFGRRASTYFLSATTKGEKAFAPLFAARAILHFAGQLTAGGVDVVTARPCPVVTIAASAATRANAFMRSAKNYAVRSGKR